jgi:hypothetical protein
MQTVTSIQTANRQYDTGDKPVLVLCSDMHEYVCKYALNGNVTNLFCEYVAASFLRLWQLPVPDFAFVKISHDHVKDFRIPTYCIDKTSFGSKYSKFYQELTHFTDSPDLKKQKAYMDNRDNLLKIALFDIWISNEDRNYNNLNLLLDIENNYNFVPIDHGAIFNTRTMDYPMTLLTENECITDIPLVKLLFQRIDFNLAYVQNMKDYFYLCTLECKKNFNQILELMPPDWSIDIAAASQKFDNELFNANWETQVIDTFLNYIDTPF